MWIILLQNNPGVHISNIVITIKTYYYEKDFVHTSLSPGRSADDEGTRGIADETKAEPSLIQKILTAIIPFIMNLFGKKDEAEEKVEEVKDEVKEEKEGLLGNIKEGLGNLTSGLSGLFTGKKDE